MCVLYVQYQRKALRIDYVTRGFTGNLRIRELNDKLVAGIGTAYTYVFLLDTWAYSMFPCFYVYCFLIHNFFSRYLSMNSMFHYKWIWYRVRLPPTTSAGWRRRDGELRSRDRQLFNNGAAGSYVSNNCLFYQTKKGLWRRGFTGLRVSSIVILNEYIYSIYASIYLTIQQSARSITWSVISLVAVAVNLWLKKSFNNRRLKKHARQLRMTEEDYHRALSVVVMTVSDRHAVRRYQMTIAVQHFADILSFHSSAVTLTLTRWSIFTGQ